MFSDLRLVQMRKLVLFRLAAKAELVDQFERVAQRIAALELVLDLAENLADFVFDRVGPLGALAEAAQIGKQLAVDIVDEVRPGQRVVMVESAFLGLRRGPFRPAVRGIDDEGVGLALELRQQRAFLLEVVEIFKEQYPRSLLGVIELRRAPRLLPENVVDVLERLLEHEFGPPAIRVPAFVGYVLFLRMPSGLRPRSRHSKPPHERVRARRLGSPVGVDHFGGVTEMVPRRVCIPNRSVAPPPRRLCGRRPAPRDGRLRQRLSLGCFALLAMTGSVGMSAAVADLRHSLASASEFL
jgi:hypothetical protein